MIAGICLDLRFDFWTVDKYRANGSLQTQIGVGANYGQQPLGSPGAKCFAKPFWQRNRTAGVEIHSNVDLRGLSAELAIADAGYPVFEYG